ncbi:Phytochrome-like protein cph2 [Acaryochloris thomasi RCC1774]|uniref:Phytochrome-like protein cph2 n=1 Tax=Acaryochloris thomasi RCC1774 TaxID=1764569 RepID=A0A2W1JFQ0_9CYAN|nr:diguanylate cyclase [Acaryochloris thomasi]PZD72418.1 Phytochrome-like protein cph2 [Acaryochloris thomasi RCC1774]
MFNKILNILLVEDNPDDAFLIGKLLTASLGSQFELATVERLSDACTCLDSNHFDVCLLDLHLPDSVGLDSLLSLHNKNPGLPIVILTGLDDEDLATQALQLGAQDYLMKGQVNSTWLKRTIYHAMERTRLLEKIRTHEQQMQQLNLLLRDRLKRRTTAIHQMHEQVQVLKTISFIDALTQIKNRLGFDQKLEQEWLRAIGNRTSLSLIMIDIDYFKQFNDTYGHPEGDRCLKRVAQAIEAGLHRPQDLVARYGGEEFVVILPETSETGAIQVAERICTDVRDLKIAHLTSPLCDRITISLGVATSMPQDNELPQDLIVKADQALYQAKHQGRDRISCDRAIFKESII